MKRPGLYLNSATLYFICFFLRCYNDIIILFFFISKKIAKLPGFLAVLDLKRPAQELNPTLSAPKVSTEPFAILLFSRIFKALLTSGKPVT